MEQLKGGVLLWQVTLQAKKDGYNQIYSLMIFHEIKPPFPVVGSHYLLIQMRHHHHHRH